MSEVSVANSLRSSKSGAARSASAWNGLVVEKQEIHVWPSVLDAEEESGEAWLLWRRMAGDAGGLGELSTFRGRQIVISCGIYEPRGGAQLCRVANWSSERVTIGMPGAALQVGDSRRASGSGCCGPWASPLGRQYEEWAKLTLV